MTDLGAKSRNRKLYACLNLECRVNTFTGPGDICPGCTDEGMWLRDPASSVLSDRRDEIRRERAEREAGRALSNIVSRPERAEADRERG